MSEQDPRVLAPRARVRWKLYYIIACIIVATAAQAPRATTTIDDPERAPVLRPFVLQPGPAIAQGHASHASHRSHRSHSSSAGFA